MAKATEAEVRKLEAALMDQFYSLVQGAHFRINLARLGDPNKPLSDNIAFVTYSKMFENLVNKWIQREAKYEVQLLKHNVKGIIASGDIKKNDFYYSESLPKLDMLVKKYDATPTNGIGWVAAAIWAVAIIVGLFEAYQITDDLTTTTQEKEQLMQTTAKTCKDLNLTAEQCNAMITSTQAQASESSSGGIVKIAVIGILALFIVPKIIPSTSKS